MADDARGPVYPPDPVLDSRIEAGLKLQTALVRRLVEEGGYFDGSSVPGSNEARFPRDRALLLACRKRFELMRRHGLFIDTHARSWPGEERIVELQGYLATYHHCLHYDKTSRPPRWTLGPEGYRPNSYGRRAHTYLNRLIKPAEAAARPDPNEDTYIDGPPSSEDTEFGKPEQVTFPKADMALIGHTFGLPLAVLSVPDDDLFEELVGIEVARRKKTANKDLLLACDDLGLIRAVAEEFSDLEVYDEAARAATRRDELYRDTHAVNQPAVARAVGALVRDQESVATDKPLFHLAKLPFDFRRTHALLFEVDEARNVTLLSLAPEIDDNVSFEGFFESPRDARGGLTLGLPEDVGSATTTLMLVMIKADELTRTPWLPQEEVSMDMFSFYGESRKLQKGTAPSPLTQEQLRELRELLFSLPRSDWKVLEKDIHLQRPV